MSTRFRFILIPFMACAAIAAAAAPVSDPTGIYGIIDKVVFAPDSVAPTSVQVWGAFSISKGIPGDNYEPAARGYLYFSIAPGQERAARAEWFDLKSVAGKNQIVGFGTHYARPAQPRIRCATERPATPDVYLMNIGVVWGLKDPPNRAAAQIRTDLSSGKAPAVQCSTPRKD